MLGAVNRCWKCGLAVAALPAEEPLDAILLEEGATAFAPLKTGSPFAAVPMATGERIDAQRAALTAMGGTVGAMILGLFALPVAYFRFEGALIALLGFVLGVWGLYSPRRRWALVALLLCCLAIGLASYTGARQVYVQLRKNQPLQGN